MPRVVKHPDLRRAELLDRASALFVQRGYDNVSLNDLIADAGVSKGAFYHWFPSKEALITALAERSAQVQVAAVADAVTRCDGNALDRLNALLQAGFDVKMREGTAERLAATLSLLRPENSHLYTRIVAAGDVLAKPLISELISAGVREGVFDTFDPEGVADMIQGLAARTSTNILQIADAPDAEARNRAIDVMVARLRLHGLAIDRILGLPDGSITVLTADQVNCMVAALPR